MLTWNGILIDGHNRYEICTKHGLAFSVVEKEFSDSGTAKLWMIDNQNGRRNLTDGWKFQLSQAKKEILLEQGKIAQVRKPVDSVLSTIDKTNHNTRETIANDLGWSTGKVAMADKVWKEATPEVKEQVLTGEVSINEAYKGIKKVERAIDIEKQRENIANNVMAKIDGLFEVIIRLFERSPTRSLEQIRTSKTIRASLGLVFSIMRS